MARPVVCVVGAGTAGLEALLSAREELGPSAELRLIAPEREFRYRPKSASLFRPAGEGSLAIGDLVAEVGATWVKSSAEAVYQAERTVLTRDGDTVDFDYLLLAPGTRSKRALRQGYLWVRGGDPSFLDRIIQGLLAGEARSVAVAVPRGARWPLPAYELALVLSWSTAGTGARITLITTEERPLGALGAAAADVVARELDAAGVEAIAGVEVADGRSGDGADSVCVRLGPGSVAEFDRVIALPIAVGPFIGGVATDASGFVDVDETLRVCGSERVWAAGGCIAAALEHSALGARQADTAIAAIAAAISGATAPVAPDLDRHALDRAARPMAGREPRRDARALHPLPVVAAGTCRRADAGATHRRVGPVGHRSGAGPSRRRDHSRAGRSRVQRRAPRSAPARRSATRFEPRGCATSSSGS